MGSRSGVGRLPESINSIATVISTHPVYTLLTLQDSLIFLFSLRLLHSHGPRVLVGWAYPYHLCISLGMVDSFLPCVFKVMNSM